MFASEAVGAVWRWIMSHKAATALIVVLLTLVPLLPEYRIVDFAGRNEEGIKKLLCSKLPAECGYRHACSTAIEFQIRLSLKIDFRDKRPLIPGLFQRRRKAYVFDYADWKREFMWQHRLYDSIARDFRKAYPDRGGAPCPASQIGITS